MRGAAPSGAPSRRSSRASVVEPMLLTIGAASSAVGPRQSRIAGLVLEPASRFLPIPGRASSPAEDPQLTSASSWQEAVVPPGGAPTPPECVAANHARGRRTKRDGSFSRIVRRSRERISAPFLRPAPHSRRLMRAPLREQGRGMIPQDSRPGINSHGDVNDPNYGFETT